MRIEGGFQGRTNKLVDGCYSFWQGGVFPLLDTLLFETFDDWKSYLYSLNKLKTGNSTTDNEKLFQELVKSYGGYLFNQRTLQEYLLFCCQETTGGFKDKPGKPKDLYHTCYGISGLSVAQNNYKLTLEQNNIPTTLGLESNLLKPVHPVYNISVQKAKAALSYFQKLDPVTK